MADLSGSSSSVTLVRRAIIVLLVAFLVMGALSSHRAWVPVRSVDLEISGTTLHDGSIVHSEIVGTGRVPVTLRVELVQGTRTDTLALQRVRGNRDGFWDPRSRRGSVNVVLSPELLSHYQAGPAIVRATGQGGMQWRREPPPVVREIAVQIER
jgi:hypothetical protein